MKFSSIALASCLATASAFTSPVSIIELSTFQRVHWLGFVLDGGVSLCCDKAVSTYLL